MRSVQQFVDLPEIASCLPRSSFPFSEDSFWEFSNWTYAKIGNSSKGEEPKLLFNSATGLIHIQSFAYTGTLRHSRRKVNPKNKVCLPIKDGSCWPVKAQWQIDSCSLCCDPNKGPFGDPSCWTRADERGIPRTFERCCQTDFKNVMCEEIRKSTPGCLDCAQSLSFYCEEAHKFRAVKAWQAMNETWFEYLEEQNKSRDFRAEVAGNRSLLAEREKTYISMIPEKVELDTKWETSMGQRAEYRALESRVRQDNATLGWLNDDFRNPIFGNFSAVKKDLDKLTRKFKDLNASLVDHVGREAKEKLRKEFLTDRLFNYSKEIPKIEDEIREIDNFFIGDEYKSLTREFNESLETVKRLNETLIREAEFTVSRLRDELKESELKLSIAERENGLVELRGKLEGKSNALKSVLVELEAVKGKLKEIRSRKSDCEYLDARHKTVECLEERKRQFESGSTEWKKIASKSANDEWIETCEDLSDERFAVNKRLKNMRSVCWTNQYYETQVAEYRRYLMASVRRLESYKETVRAISSVLFESLMQEQRLGWWVFGEMRMGEIPPVINLKDIPSFEGEVNKLKAIVQLVKKLDMEKERLMQIKYLKEIEDMFFKNKQLIFSELILNFNCDEILVRQSLKLSLKLYLADLERELAECAERNERTKSCESFSAKELKKQERNLERIQPVADRLTAEVSDYAKQIESKLCAECVSVRGEVDARKSELQGAEKELKSVQMQRDSALASVRETRDRIDMPQRRRESLEKLLRDANDNKPKMEEELLKKDELILNITSKRIEINQTMFELEPKIIAQTDNFTVWNLSLNSIDTDIGIVNKSLWKNLEEQNLLAGDLPNTMGVQFDTASFILNETFYNLTFAEESLENSTRRISELVDLFRQSESFYLQKESELKEYTSNVEKGLIQKVDFKFEY